MDMGQRPSGPSFQPSQLGLRQYPDIPAGLDAIFEAYQRRKMMENQMGIQQAQTATQRGANLLQFGLDPSQVTPEVIASAQGPSLAEESPLIKATREYMGTKKREREAEIGAKEAQSMKGMGESDKEIKTLEGKLRGELQDLSKPFYQVRDSYNRVEASARNPSAAGDLALLFNYMKILDPGSVVRESEFAQAADTGSFGERIKAAVGKVVKGERLSADMRQDFIDRARDLYKAQLKQQTHIETSYGGLVERYGGTPGNVVLPLGVPGISSQQGIPLAPSLPNGTTPQSLIQSATGQTLVPPPTTQTPTPRKTAEQRYGELTKQGMKEEDVYKKMASEGY